MTHLGDARLQDLAGGAAPADDERDHLALCDACRAERDAYRALSEVLATLRPGSPAAGFAPAVMARIDARRRTLLRQLLVALVLPVAGLALFGGAFREAAALSFTRGVGDVLGILGGLRRLASFVMPFASAWSPYLALAVVCLVALSIPLVRLLEVPMRSRSKNVAAALVLALAVPSVAHAERSPRLSGEWPAEERRVTLDLDAAAPDQALQKLGEAAGWSVIVPSFGGRQTSLHLRDVPADAALASLLAEWDLRASRTGSLVTILQANPIQAPPPVPALPALPATTAPAPQSAPDRVATGNDLVIAEGETVNDVAVLAGNLEVRGEVLRNATVVGGNLTVRSSGHVHGNTSVAGGNLEVEPGGRLDGERTAVGAGVAAKAVEEIARSARREKPGAMGILSDVFGTLSRGVAFFVLGLLLSVFAKDRINVVTAEIQSRPLRTFGTGLVAVVAIPVLTILLCVVIIGIPVVPFLWLGAVLATFAGMTSIALLVGEHLPILEGKKTQIVCLAIGAAVLTVLDFLPWIGGLAIAAASVLALGAVVRTRFAKPNGKAPPPSDEFAYRSPA
jgi:hypothetical protein